jgi:hypothetical protein
MLKFSRKVILQLKSSRIVYISSFGNPMFPERPVEIKKPMDLDPKNLPKHLQGEEDFLFKHGGKVAGVAFATAVFLIYRFFKSGSDKSEVETYLNSISPLEPYEANELRLSNNITTEEYDYLVSDLFKNEIENKQSVI